MAKFASMLLEQLCYYSKKGRDDGILTSISPVDRYCRLGQGS